MKKILDNREGLRPPMFLLQRIEDALGAPIHLRAFPQRWNPVIHGAQKDLLFLLRLRQVYPWKDLDDRRIVLTPVTSGGSLRKHLMGRGRQR